VYLEFNTTVSEFRQDQSGISDGSEVQELPFSGEVVRSLTVEQLKAIGQLALSVGVEMRVIREVEQGLGASTLAITEQDEAEPEPVPVTRKDLVAFTDQHGYPRMGSTATDVDQWCVVWAGGR